MNWSRCLTANAIAVCIVYLACCSAGQITSRSHEAHTGDLVSGLELVSTTFHLPIITELTKSYPARVSLPAGEGTAAQLLNELSGQSPYYTWVIREGVVLFYDTRLADAPGNFFNAKLERFVMPPDLAELALELNQAMGAEPDKPRVMVGVLDKRLQNVKLHGGEVLSNVTGRDVMVEAAKQSNNLFSVVLFPTATPKTKRDEAEGHMNWYIRSIDELPQNPTRLRSIPGSP